MPYLCYWSVAGAAHSGPRQPPHKAGFGEQVFATVLGVEQSYLLDSLARSLAMLSPGAPALDREQAMKIVAQLEDAEQRLALLIAELRRLADEAERR